MTDHPPHDPEGAQLTYDQGIACDHHFGDDGTSPVCTQCDMDRDTAERVGRAHHKIMRRQKLAEGS